MNTEYIVRDREAGNIIEKVNSMKEGIELIEQFESEDKAEGIYEENFYECVKSID